MSTRDLLDRALATAGVEPVIAVETSQREAIAPLVLAGAGTSFLPAAGRRSAQGAVVARLVPTLTRTVGLVHRAAPLTPAGRSSSWPARPAVASRVGRNDCRSPRGLPWRRSERERGSGVDVLASRQAPDADERCALPGRPERPFAVPERHFVLGTPLEPPFPEGFEQAVFGMGCFWGAERKFWEADGVYTTAVGYAGGFTPNPTYEEVCSGRTGHTEVVLVVFDPRGRATTTCCGLLGEPRSDAGHAPGQRRRDAVPVGDLLLRSGAARGGRAVAAMFQPRLTSSGFGEITTEIEAAPTFFYAEDYHQQYLAKNPGGYCGIGGTGVSCPIGVARTE